MKKVTMRICIDYESADNSTISDVLELAVAALASDGLLDGGGALEIVGWDSRVEILEEMLEEPPLKRYLVGVREVHVSNRSVLATSADDAMDKADDLEVEVYGEYSHTMDRGYWTVQEIDL